MTQLQQPTPSGAQWAAPPGAPQWGNPRWSAPQAAWSPPQGAGSYPGGGGYVSATRPQAGLSTRAKVLFVLVVLPILLLAMIALLNALLGPEDYSPPPQPPTTTTTTTSPTLPPTASPTTSPTVEPTKPPASAGEYLHDDYVVPAPDPNPPALPMPRTMADINMFLKNNPLYQQSVPVPVRCEIDQLDLTTASKSQLQTHFDQLTACLMRVWAPALEAAGFEAVRPTVTIYSGQIQSACGKLPDQNAVYCGADQQVYYASNLPGIIPGSLRGGRFVVDSIVAHEFGHAIQGRSGILLSESYIEQTYAQDGDEAAANDSSRRTEMQADCFAGEFLQAVARSTSLAPEDEALIGQLYFTIGDDQLTGDPFIDGNHGWGANRSAWIAAGLRNPQLNTCNAFMADANSVR